jgi:hypothetical protein
MANAVPSTASYRAGANGRTCQIRGDGGLSEISFADERKKFLAVRGMEG